MTDDTVGLARIESGRPDGPVLLLANAIGTSWDMWDAQLPMLEPHFRVIRFDHRGQGRSPLPVRRGRYRMEELGYDVLAMLDDLGVSSANFAGMSLGGMVGLWLAARVPDRVERLALLCTSARLEPASTWQTRANAVRRGGLPELAPLIVERWFTPAFAARRPEVVTRFTSMLVASPPEGYASCCEAIAEFDGTADLPWVVAPTLVVAGGGDLAIPVEHSQRIADGIAGARLAIVPDAAHLANVEQPDAIGALLLEHFVEQLRDTTTPIKE